MSAVEVAELVDHLARGRQWAADCGIEFQASGYTARMRWEYAETAFPCAVCGADVLPGRLTVKRAHVACVPAADWVRDGFEASDSASGRWHRDTIRATKLKGDASTSTPTAASAAKALAKVDPLKAPRFTVSGVDAGGPLAQAARAWSMAAEVARSGAHAVPTVKAPAKPKAAPKPKTAKDWRTWSPEPKAEPVAEVVYRDVPAVAEPVAERLERVARVVDHFAPTVVIESVPVLPAAVEEWLGRLVFGPKADYARAYVAHLLSGAPAPEDPGAEWAEKARKRAVRVVAQVTR